MATRNIEKELFIQADPESVWQAFTEADRIQSWFAPNAASEPGVGGFIDLAWDGQETTRCHILEWEENSHLLMTWRDAPGGEHPLPVELNLVRKDGGTLLRLVHSGFLSDASWDNEFSSHSRGWSYELRSLKLYVETQFNKTRNYVMERFPLKGERGAVWKKIIGTIGVLEAGKSLVEGEEFEVQLPGNENSQGTLLFSFTDTDFAFISDALAGGVFRFSFENFGNNPEIWVWALSWSLTNEQIKKLIHPMFKKIRQISDDTQNTNAV